MGERSIDWLIIDRYNKPIGALGFIGNRVAIITAFYDDRDGDKSGDLNVVERLAGFFDPKVEGSAVVEVAQAASINSEVILRDAGFAQEAVDIWLSFAAKAIAEGIYTVYMARGVKAAGGAVAQQIGGNAVREFAIRKGMDKAVKELYDAAVSP